MWCRQGRGQTGRYPRRSACSAECVVALLALLTGSAVLWLLLLGGARVFVYVCAQVRFVVLDEADQMLDMGFQEDMEVILQQVCIGMRL